MASEKLTIREVTFSELDLLRKLSIDTFLDTYGSENTEENMGLYLSTYFSEKSLAQQFKNKTTFFYFAERGKSVIGYLKLNFGDTQTENKVQNALEIERIYVLKDFQGQKIGIHLLQHSFNLAKQLTLKSIWLGVWSKNTKAILFYEKNGFIAFDSHPFMLGNDLQEDVMMKLDL
ncbi:GNAT family N-acetyltransferase [Ulvibacter antarcticus]|uniref:Ribosomal protein S18 acetylase RimI-like enzyme n=1 Tax=Ulvibacter antarcticus TaxID=442714 RepID=A0A3L9YGP7_9FLAO|nr:GNAT family N-acetyltransferase [Ulvibacter antarcticus]RMA57058.1 ribosomal protein S18 acetylase RimI-like enzyme [Ulvibacter antarcticus]